MAKPKPLYGKVVTGQVLTEEYIIDWTNELSVKKEFDLKPSHVNVNKWKSNISKVDVVNETNAKNVKSAIIRGAVGNIALGGVGTLAGVLSAKSDTTFNVMITYRNNEIDLIECDIQLYTKLTQIANENSKLENTEYEDVYYSEEEQKQNEDEWRKNLDDNGGVLFGCGVIIAILAVISFFVWVIFFMD